jgi:hypothetical protein
MAARLLPSTRGGSSDGMEQAESKNKSAIPNHRTTPSFALIEPSEHSAPGARRSFTRRAVFWKRKETVVDMKGFAVHEGKERTAIRAGNHRFAAERPEYPETLRNK